MQKKRPPRKAWKQFQRRVFLSVYVIVDPFCDHWSHVDFSFFVLDSVAAPSYAPEFLL